MDYIKKNKKVIKVVSATLFAAAAALFFAIAVSPGSFQPQYVIYDAVFALIMAILFALSTTT